MDMKVARGPTESKAFEPTAALQEWDRASWQLPVDIRSASLALLAALASLYMALTWLQESLLAVMMRAL